MKNFYHLIILLALSSCLKQKPETPNTNGNIDPALTVNFSLSKLNALLPKEGVPILIDSDWTIAVIVRANDESGNLNEQIIIEDSTGGLALMLNENSLYTRYPIGRKLYLRLKGLYIGNYYGSNQLGGSPSLDNSGLLQVSALLPKSFAQHIVVANMPLEQLPIKVSLQDLTNTQYDLINRLIEIEEIEFNNPSYDNTYAEPTAATSVKMKNCLGTMITLRTSNYARFASAELPYGKGRMTAVYTVYKGSGQLLIRDTSDIKFGLMRCDASVSENPVAINIDSVRKMHHATDTVIGNYTISGVVTSNAVHQNFGAGNIILQDTSGGLVVYFGSSASILPDMGDSVTIQIAGATLTRYNGTLELKNIKSAKIKILANNKVVQAVQMTIATLNANFARYESVLVRINNAKITSKGNYSGNNTLSDATGNIILYTSSNASFAADLVPNITKSFQGIATYFGTTQELKIRHPSIDVY
jgi:DNA/RNA endonuclease YhcR with UshA esterase domain